MTDLRSDFAFDQLLANVVGQANHSDKSARQIADEVKAAGGDASDAAGALIRAGFGASHPGSWRGVLNEVLGVGHGGTAIVTTDRKPTASAPGRSAALTAHSRAGAPDVESAAVDDKQVDPHEAAWAADANLQREFGSATQYAALKRAEARGNGRAHKGATVTGR